MDDLLNMLRASAEKTRLRLLAFCAHGELTVGELSQILGQSQPLVSRHLKILCDAGLLERSKEGNAAYFRVAFEGPGAEFLRRVLPLLPQHDETLARDLARLKLVKSARARRAETYAVRLAKDNDLSNVSTTTDRQVAETLREVVFDYSVQRLLDIGTGTGRVLEAMADRVGVAVGVDTSREMLAMARANLDAAGLTNCRVRHADLNALPFSDGSFDAVTMHHVLRFVDDPEGAVREASRVLADGARIAVIDFTPGDREMQVSGVDHRRFGFIDVDMDIWFRAAGLTPESAIKLPGGPMTVGIWHGVRAHAIPEGHSQERLS